MEAGDVRHRDEQGNGRPQAGEPPPGTEGGTEVALVEDQPARYLTAVSLKKRIHTETTKVNNELRALITKEIRKPGRRRRPRVSADVDLSGSSVNPPSSSSFRLREDLPPPEADPGNSGHAAHLPPEHHQGGSQVGPEAERGAAQGQIKAPRG